MVARKVGCMGREGGMHGTGREATHAGRCDAWERTGRVATRPGSGCGRYMGLDYWQSTGLARVGRDWIGGLASVGSDCGVHVAGLLAVHWIGAGRTGLDRRIG